MNLRRWACVLAASPSIISCGGEPPRRGDPLELRIDGEDDWEYPYYLVIGGGLSETLSVLEVSGPERFVLHSDVQITGSAINQTVVRGDEFYAVNSLSHSVTVYNPSNLSILREVSVGAGRNPMFMDFSDAVHAWISAWVTNEVVWVDLSGGGAMATVPLPASSHLPRDPDVEATWARPSTVCRDGDRVLVVLSNLRSIHTAGGPGLLAVIHNLERRLDRVIAMEGRAPQWVGFVAEEEAFHVLSAGDYDPETGFVGNGMMEVLDRETLTVRESVAIPGAPFERVVTPEGVAYMGNGKEGAILSMDLASRRIRTPLDLRDQEDPPGLSFVSALALDGHGLLYASEFNRDRLVIFDTRNGDRKIAEFTVNDGPDTLAWLQ